MEILKDIGIRYFGISFGNYDSSQVQFYHFFQYTLLDVNALSVGDFELISKFALVTISLVSKFVPFWSHAELPLNWEKTENSSSLRKKKEHTKQIMVNHKGTRMEKIIAWITNDKLEKFR